MKWNLIAIVLWVLSGLAIFLPGCDFSPNSMYQLTFEDDIQARHPVWSPLGDKIAFSGINEEYRGLWTIDPQGENLTLILDSEEFGEGIYNHYTFDYSDDDYLLFTDDLHNIYYLPPDGGEPVFICQGCYPTVKGNIDGTYNIAYIIHGEENGIYLTDIHGSEPQFLVNKNYLYYVDWSPDGNRLVYVQNLRTTDVWYSKIYVYDFVTHNENIIYEAQNIGDIYCPRWSPDGQWIAFTMPCETTSKGEVYIIPAEGGEPTRLTEFPYFSDIDAPGACSLSWSPYGNWIAFDLLRNELWKVSVE